MQNWPSYECLKLPPKITRARKKRQGARLAENDNKITTKSGLEESGAENAFISIQWWLASSRVWKQAARVDFRG